MNNQSNLWGEPFSGSPLPSSFAKGDIMGDYDGDVFGDVFGDELMGDDPIANALAVIGDHLGVGDITAELIGDLNQAVKGPSFKKSGIGKMLNIAYNKAQSSGNTKGASDLKKSVDTLAKVPGGIGNALALPPYILKNGNMVKYNTRVTIKGENLMNFIYRFESQLVAPSVTLIQNGAGVGSTNTFTFNGTPASGLQYAGPILIAIRSSNLNAVDDLTFEASFGPLVKTEAGASYTNFGTIRFAQKRALNQSGTNSTYLYLFPYIDLASVLLPVALQANSTNATVLLLKDIPTSYIAEVTLLSPDSKYWEDFKSAFGLSFTNKIITYK